MSENANTEPLDPVAEAIKKVQAMREASRQNPKRAEEIARERAAPPPTFVEPPKQAQKEQRTKGYATFIERSLPPGDRE